jgi:hypothetical protein
MVTSVRFTVYGLIFLVMMIAGCGGGGDSKPPAKASLVFTTGFPDSYVDQIGSINLTVVLPAGVTVPADVNGLIPHGNLAFSGEGAKFAAKSSFAIIMGKYTPATATAKAYVSIVVNTLENSAGSVSGMNPGEFATLVCDVAPGSVYDTTTLAPLSGIVVANTKGDILSYIVPPLVTLTYDVTVH